MNFYQELQWRNLINQITSKEIIERLKNPITLYVGFDPTSDSLHVGNLIQILALMRAQRCGHIPIALIGGATALIGDPSGKSNERNSTNKEIIEQNTILIKKQLEQYLDNNVKILNNIDWFSKIDFLTFIRNVGKHVTVNTMLSKESVKSRISNGISYAEFSYMLAQGYDFYHLYKNHNCELQIGGSDQWGNITIGIDLISKLENKTVYGITQPLILNSLGKKIGKTENGTIFIDKEKTKIFDFYQYFVRTADADVINYLKFFTDLKQKDIEVIEKIVYNHSNNNEAQRILAFEVTKFVFGEILAKEVIEFSNSLYKNNFHEINMSNIPKIILQKELLNKTNFLEIIVKLTLAKSKTEAKNLIQNKGIKVYEIRVDDINYKLTEFNIRNNKIVIQKGKNYGVILITP
jgi:tyrosyl-tRNA synthetase